MYLNLTIPIFVFKWCINFLTLYHESMVLKATARWLCGSHFVKNEFFTKASNHFLILSPKNYQIYAQHTDSDWPIVPLVACEYSRLSLLLAA